MIYKFCGEYNIEMKNEKCIFDNMNKIKIFESIKDDCEIKIKKLELQNLVLKEIITKENLNYDRSGNTIFLHYQIHSMILNRDLFLYLLDLLGIPKENKNEYFYEEKGECKMDKIEGVVKYKKDPFFYDKDGNALKQKVKWNAGFYYCPYIPDIFRQISKEENDNIQKDNEK